MKIQIQKKNVWNKKRKNSHFWTYNNFVVFNVAVVVAATDVIVITLSLVVVGDIVAIFTRSKFLRIHLRMMHVQMMQVMMIPVGKIECNHQRNNLEERERESKKKSNLNFWLFLGETEGKKER